MPFDLNRYLYDEMNFGNPLRCHLVDLYERFRNLSVPAQQELLGGIREMSSIAERLPAIADGYINLGFHRPRFMEFRFQDMAVVPPAELLRFIENAEQFRLEYGDL
jgi:hypothetical protein